MIKLVTKLNTRIAFTTFVLLIFGFVYYFIKIPMMNAPDLKVFYVAAGHAINSPLQIYKDSPDLFLYPPFASFFFTPLHLFPTWEWARDYWYIQSIVLLALLASRSWAHFLAIVFLFRFFMINLHYGQINIVLLSGYLLYSGLFHRNRKKKGGFLLGTLGTIKIFPAVGAIAPLAKKDFRTLAVFILTAVFWALFPFIFWKFDIAVQVWQQYPQQLQFKGTPIISHNQSMTALLFRLFSGRGFELFQVGEMNWTIATLPDWALRMIALSFGGTLSFFAWKKSIKRNDSLSTAAAMGFTLLFCSHLIWKDYLIFLFPALVAVLKDLKRPLINDWARILVLFNSWLLMSFTNQDILGYGHVSRWDALALHLWISIIVFSLWMRISPKE